LTRSRWWFAYLMLGPVVGLFFYLRGLPILKTFWMSFFNWSMVNQNQPFVGLTNFLTMFKDIQFQLALKNTTIFAFVTVLISVPLSLVLAAVLAKPRRFSAFYEAIYFIPSITPMVAVAVAWKWILDAKFGLLNYVLGFLGVEPKAWLIDPRLAMVSVILLSAWKILGHNMIIFLVGIRNIPGSYFEAASIDGASPLQRFWHITVPLLTPITLFVAVMTTINSYNVFTQVYVLASDVQGSPGFLVRVLAYDIVENAFSFFKMGYASSEAVVLCLIVLALTFIQFRWLKDRTV